jgi:hypothetical protein
MKRWVLWTVMLMLATALTTSCGDDSGDDGPKAGNGGGAGNGGPPMKIECNSGEMACGTECCGSSDPAIPACCADDFAGTCGNSVSSFGGGTPACVPRVPTFEGCPSLVIPVVGFMVPSCCTAEKMCGLEGTLFGMPGCTELGEAAMRAMQMFMRPMTPSTPTDEDGGVAGAGGMSGGSAGAGGRRGGGFLPMFPAPQACPAN